MGSEDAAAAGVARGLGGLLWTRGKGWSKIWARQHSQDTAYRVWRTGMGQSWGIMGGSKAGTGRAANSWCTCSLPVCRKLTVGSWR